MNRSVYESAKDYFEDVGRLLNDDRKYVKKAEKLGSIERVKGDLNTPSPVYELRFRLFLNNHDIENRNSRQTQKILRHHFGSWFALLEGGSRNVSVEEIEDNRCTVSVRYVSNEEIYN